MRWWRTPWKVYAFFAVALVVVVAVVAAYALSEGGLSAPKPSSRSSAAVGNSQLKALCPFGLDAKACVDIQQADVDGDGNNDLASVVFNNRLSTGMIHVLVRFSTGEVSSEQLYFGDDSRVADAASSKVSFLGFADINGQPGQEIFVRIFVGGHWDFAMVQYRGNKSIAHGLTTFYGGFGLDVSDGKFFDSDGVSTGRIAASGLRYADIGEQKNVLVVWIVCRYSDGSFEVRALGYAPKPDSFAYQLVSNGTEFEVHPASEADMMDSIIAQQRASTSPGFAAQ